MERFEWDLLGGVIHELRTRIDTIEKAILDLNSHGMVQDDIIEELKTNRSAYATQPSSDKE